MFFENINDFSDVNNLFGIPNNYNYAYNYQNNNVNELSPKFLRGNMFDNEFVPYKNLKYIKPTLKVEREMMLAKIMESSFAVTDYVLYLDVNPGDQDILNKYKEETKKLEMLKNEYEKMYGPLCNTNGDYEEYKWIESPWPWERNGGMYV